MESVVLLQWWLRIGSESSRGGVQNEILASILIYVLLMGVNRNSLNKESNMQQNNVWNELLKYSWGTN